MTKLLTPSDEFFIVDCFRKNPTSKTISELARSCSCNAEKIRYFLSKIPDIPPIQSCVKSWSNKEDDVLRQNYKEKTCLELSQILGRTLNAIHFRKSSLGLSSSIKKMKICINCGKQYLGLSFQKFCSLPCGKQYRYKTKYRVSQPLQTKECKNCKKSFQPIPRHVKFCSIECRKKYKYYKPKPVVIKQCWACGNKFETGNKAKHSCSLQCQYENQAHNKRLFNNIMIFLEEFHPEILNIYFDFIKRKAPHPLGDKSL